LRLPVPEAVPAAHCRTAAVRWAEFHRGVNMHRITWSVLVCVAALSAGTAKAGDEQSVADRVVALEAEAKRLLAALETLKGRLPEDAVIRAELKGRYEKEVGEPIPTDVLDREADAVLRQTRSSLDAAVRRAVEAGAKRPLVGAMASPMVLLQVRSGAGGGNPNRVDMLGKLSIYVERRSRAPLSWNPVVDMNEKSSAYVLGGTIPEGKAFAVTKVTWRAVAAGDSNGHGAYVVRLGKETIGQDRDTAATYSGSWNGRVLIHRGEESSVHVEIANSSAVEARFEGEFVDDAR
jgi:hypothetical protein